MPKTHKTLELELGSATLRFPSVDDFKFALASRTAAPLTKLDELRGLSLDELMSQARSIRAVERRLLSILDESLAEPAAIDRRLRELDARVFSEDHDWRAIMGALNQAASEFDEYKQAAVVKYLQYLASRQDLVKRVYADKAWGDEGGARPAEPDVQMQMRETAIFDRIAIAPSVDAAPWTRLPRGETRLLRLAAGGTLPLRLSVHVFELERGEDLVLRGERGETYPLPAGRCHLGRAHDNEVVLDPAYRAVSRRHLVIEPDGDAVAITDLSSHGTFVRADDAGG